MPYSLCNYTAQNLSFVFRQFTRAPFTRFGPHSKFCDVTCTSTCMTKIQFQVGNQIVCESELRPNCLVLTKVVISIFWLHLTCACRSWHARVSMSVQRIPRFNSVIFWKSARPQTAPRSACCRCLLHFFFCVYLFRGKWFWFLVAAYRS